MTWWWIWYFLVVAWAQIPYKLSLFSDAGWRYARAHCLRFLLGSALLSPPLVFWHFPIHHASWTWIPYILCTCCWFVTPVLAQTYGKSPSVMLKQHPKRFLARLETPVWTMKYIEVLFQQTMFVFLAYLLLQTFTRDQSIVWFTILISGIHIVNLFCRDVAVSVLFFLLSIPMAFLFGYLILEGYVLITLSIHLLFYILLIGGVWFSGDREIRSSYFR